MSVPAASLEPPARPARSLEPFAHLLSRIEGLEPAAEPSARLVRAAVKVRARPSFETFVSLGHLRFEPFDYQLQAAEAVLRRMRGRAIMADEVGLGKTIEAGLVLSELRLRGLARRVLVVCPAGLVAQWREELERKFSLACQVLDAGAGDGGPELPVGIASLPSARRSPLRDRLVGQEWDLVIVDEAHRVRNPSTASARLVRDLRTRHLLLLTATPVENRLSDLFNLASLVAPGLLGTAKGFRARHGGDAVAAPRELAALRARMAEVMVRHRRSQVALMLPRRLAETLVVRPGEEERELYAAVAGRVREEGAGARPAQAMALRAALRLAGSSPAALAGVAGTLRWDDVAERASAIRRPAKADALVEVLGRLGAGAPGGEKAIVFTAFRRTQDALAAVLEGAGVAFATYHGGLSRKEKEAAIGAFGDGASVLLSTEAAGEGRNLQFCHQMVNFDLPWNPMEIEQRLGRLHRIGQEHEVLVVNLAGRETIEERILGVLEAKINLFELVVGELDMILGRIDDEYDFERAVFDAHVESADDAEFAVRLGELGDRLAEARLEYLESRERNDVLVDADGDAPGGG